MHTCVCLLMYVYNDVLSCCAVQVRFGRVLGLELCGLVRTVAVCMYGLHVMRLTCSGVHAGPGGGVMVVVFDQVSLLLARWM